MTGRRKSASGRRVIRTRRRLADEATRTTLSAELKVAYEAGESIRELAAEHRLAYGTTRTLLLEAGVVLQTRGGPTTSDVIRPEPHNAVTHQPKENTT